MTKFNVLSIDYYKELQDDGTLAQISTKWFDADITIKE